jgi:hypothetical protein
MAQTGRWGINCSMAKMCKINILNNNIELYNNPRAIAIVLNHNDHAASNATVSGNTIYAGLPQPILGPPGQAAIAVGGIVVNEQLNSYPLMIKDNTIRLRRAVHGIHVNSNTKAELRNNSIAFQNTNPGQPFDRNGILLQNCEKVLLRCNSTVNAANGNAIAGRTTGINIEKSKNGTYSCNSMNRTETGMRFDGDCTGSDILTNIFNRHDVGLLYTASAITGDQRDKGNQWFGNYGTAGAVNLGGALNFNGNRYQISSVYPFAPPSVPISPGSWFEPSPNPLLISCNPQISCNGPIIAPLIALNSIDVAVVNNQMPQNPAALPWELKKGLYNKLDKNPILQLNPAMGAFYNNHQNQPIGTVVEAFDALELTGHADSTEIAQLVFYTNTAELMLDSLQQLDSLYSAGLIIDTLYQVQKMMHLQNLNQHIDITKNYNAQLQHNSSINSQQAQIINNGILPTNSQEINEQSVNEIYLQKVALGNTNFTNTELQRLYDVAVLCPDMDGNAVYRARSIYALIELENYSNSCAAMPKTAAKSYQDCHLDVHFVNPSLEGTVGTNKVPYQWGICESTPDLHPYSLGMYSASDSLTYVGVTVSPGLYNESISSKMIDTLKTGFVYKFSFEYAAFYNSIMPASISLWLGNSLCNKDQLVFSGTSTDTFWRTKTVEFIPNNNYTHFIISGEIDLPVNYGFIDNLRPVPRPRSCDSVQVVNDPDLTDSLTTEEVITDIFQLEQQLFKIYPNPNLKGLLTVEWQKNLSSGTIVILDALGRETGKYPVPERATKQQIDISHLPSGAYTVQLKKEGRVIGREKLIVMRE